MVIQAVRERNLQKRRWRQLSEIYKSEQAFCGKIDKCVWLDVGTNAEGLYLSVRSWFRDAYPGLFIPWEDVAITEKSSLWSGTRVELSFPKVPDVKIILPGWGAVADQPGN